MEVSGGDQGSVKRNPGWSKQDRAINRRSSTVPIEPQFFAHDLSLDEAARRRAVLAAIGDNWDPIDALSQEMQAYELLYSNLDPDQQRVYDELVSAGVLPDRTASRAAD
jgi:hypothetical protein